jgi:NAD-dependent dihydropyrimidine dehydrogenase PreA subunit
MSDVLNEQGHPYAELIDQGRCTGCGLCFRMCPDTAIEIDRKKTAKQ